MSVDKCLEIISDTGKSVKSSVLVELSSITPNELSAFNRIWGCLSEERKCNVVGSLLILAEDDPSLDFSSIFWESLIDPVDNVRQTAIHGLWENDDRRLVEKLVNILCHDENCDVKIAAATRLASFVDLAVEDKLLVKDRELLEFKLGGLVNDECEDINVRRRVLESIAPFNTRDISLEIMKSYESSVPELIASAVHAMARTGSENWLPMIMESLSSAIPSIRYEAVSACGILGDESIVTRLALMLDDDDLEIKMATIHSLGEIGGAEATEAIQACIDKGSSLVKSAALDTKHSMDELNRNNIGVGVDGVIP